MSDNSVGMYLDGDWYTEKPSRHTLRMTRPTKLVYQVLRLVGVVVLLLGFHAVVQSQMQLYRQDRVSAVQFTAILSIGVILIMSYALYVVVVRPGRKETYRRNLVEQGKLFTANRPVVRMVSPVVKSVWYANPACREDLGKAMNAFVGAIAAAESRGGPHWYLRPEKEHQDAWAALMLSIEMGIEECCEDLGLLAVKSRDKRQKLYRLHSQREFLSKLEGLS